MSGRQSSPDLGRERPGLLGVTMPCPFRAQRIRTGLKIASLASIGLIPGVQAPVGSLHRIIERSRYWEKMMQGQKHWCRLQRKIDKPTNILLPAPPLMSCMNLQWSLATN
jgi:hypothetical protein